MKKTATLLFMLACGCAVNVQAKTTKTSAATPFPHFSNQGAGGNAISLNTRLIKKTRYKFIGIATSAIPSDEVVYEYHSNRGSLVDIYDQSDDDVLYNVSYTNGLLQGGGTQRKLKREQHYNWNNKVDVLSYRSWKDNMYKDSIFYTYVYHAQFKNIIDAAYLNIYSGTITNQVNYLNTVNGQGNVVEMFCWGTNYHIVFQYDNAGKLLTQHDYTTIGSTTTYYEKDSFVYDGQGKISEYYIFIMANNNWKIDQQWLYSYSAGGDLDMITKKKWNGSVFASNLLQVFEYVNGNLVSDITDKWSTNTNSYQHTTKLTWTYNSNGQPTQLNTFSWINSGWNTAATDYQIVWEYQTYFPTSVYDVNNELNTNIYPIPAQQSLNIALSWKTMQPFNIAIVDMAGRTLAQWDESAVKEYHKNIPVDNMPSGNYFVVLTGRDGLRSTQKFQVAH